MAGSISFLCSVVIIPSGMAKKITAIVVNYFTVHLLPPILASLEEEPSVAEIIVADNSRQSALQDCIKPFGKAKLLTFPENIGFGAAVNRAAVMAGGDFRLVLNPDIRLLPGAITALTDAATSTGATLTGPRYYWDDQLTFRFSPATGHSLWLRTGMEMAERYRPDSALVDFTTDAMFQRHWQAQEPFAEPFLNGACLLIRNDPALFPAAKIFDEQFFIYFEDTDLSLRMLLRGDYPVCAPGATAIHYWNQSPSGQKSQMMADSEKVFIRKYYPQEVPFVNGPSLTPTGIRNLGTFHDPPEFVTDTMQSGNKLYLDVGVNHYFKPFARSHFKGHSFRFPPEIWEKLSSGTYFTRIYEARLCHTLNIFKWEKA